jgi:hypothetical protein
MSHASLETMWVFEAQNLGKGQIMLHHVMVKNNGGFKLRT